MTVKLKSRAYRHLRKELLLGRLRPGQKLSDAQLASHMGISRTPVREALIQLEADGLIEINPPIGTFVKSLTATDLRELFDLREALETFAVVAAAQKKDPATCDKLKSCCDQLLALARRLKQQDMLQWTSEVYEQIATTDMAFHVVLLSAADNRRLLSVSKTTGILINLFRHMATVPPPSVLADLVRSWRHHRRIWRAVKRGQVDQARRCVEHHLRISRDEILAAQRKTQDSIVPDPLDDLL